MVFIEEKYVISNEIPSSKFFSFSHKHLAQKLHLTYNLSDNQAISLSRAPYSGVWWEGEITEDFLKEGLQQLIKHVRDQNMNKLLIRQAPECVLASNQFLKVFEKLGFQNKPEINHHIELDSYSMDKLHPMQKRRIKKCQNSGYQLKKESVDQAEEIHHFIAHCRNQQGLTINIELAHYLRILESLPDIYEMYSILDPSGKRCAATVTIRVNDQVVYNFLPAFDREYSVYSPLSLLYYNLAQELKQAKYKYLDLGISSINGLAQESLIRFKERMGGQLSLRATFSRQL